MICDCECNYGKECLFPNEYATTGCNHSLNENVRKNVDALIEMGVLS